MSGMWNGIRADLELKADETGHVVKACRFFGIGMTGFFQWWKDHAERGEAWLVNARLTGLSDCTKYPWALMMRPPEETFAGLASQSVGLHLPKRIVLVCHPVSLFAIAARYR